MDARLFRPHCREQTENLTELRKRIKEYSENYDKTRKYVLIIAEMKMKNIPGVNRLSDTEEHIRDLKDTVVEITQSYERKGKTFKGR